MKKDKNCKERNKENAKNEETTGKKSQTHLKVANGKDDHKLKNQPQ